MINTKVLGCRLNGEAVQLFNETFRVGLTGITNSTVSKTIRRFEETGINKNRPKSGRSKIETLEAGQTKEDH